MLLALAIRALGGTLKFSVQDFAEMSVAELPGLGISVIDETVELKVGDE